jgi:hypothetical protein
MHPKLITKDENLMKITLKEFSSCGAHVPVIIRSIDMVGYQASVIMNDNEYRLVLDNGKPLRYQSLMHMREALRSMPVTSLTLQHQSACDEMINQPQRDHGNTLELPLSLSLYSDASTT